MNTEQKIPQDFNNEKSPHYAPATHYFNNFAHYVEKLEVNHRNLLPEMFFNRAQLEDVKGGPKVNFHITASNFDGDVYQTKFEFNIDHKITGKLKATGEEQNFHFYSISMLYVAMTHIDPAQNLSDRDKRAVLVVDVPYLVFPSIRHLILSTTEAMRATPVQLNPVNFLELFMRGMERSENADLGNFTENANQAHPN